MSITDADGNGNWSIGTDWPWPKVYFGRNYTLAFVKGAGDTLWVYDLYCSNSDAWTATPVLDTSIASSGFQNIHVADFGEFYAISTLTHGSNSVSVSSFLHDPSGRFVELPTNSVPTFGTCCNFNGQGIIGCIKHNDEDAWGDLGYNSVTWSRIGRFNFRIAPMGYDIDPDSKATLEPDIGYINMPWGERRKGIVHKVKKLGKGVMVYGDGGRGYLYPVNEPVVGFGFKDICRYGIRSGNHVAGSEEQHVYIDQYDEVWRISGDMKEEKLGYKDYISDLTTADIHVTYVSGRDRFYISDGVTGYCLTGDGMYSTNQLVGSAGLYRGTLCGFFLDDGDYEARVETETLDFGQRGMKTLTTIEVGGDFYDGNDTALEASVKYRYDHKDSSLTQTDWIDLNDAGVVMPGVTAPEMRILLRADDYRSNTINLDYFRMRIKMSDRRFIRGAYDASHPLARV